MLISIVASRGAGFVTEVDDFNLAEAIWSEVKAVASGPNLGIWTTSAQNPNAEYRTGMRNGRAVLVSFNPDHIVAVTQSSAKGEPC